MAAVRVVYGIGYGIVTLLFLKNSEGIGDYVSELARTSVHFWSRGPKEGRSLGDGNSRDIGELSEKLDRLASMRRETVHVHHGRNGYSGWVTTIIGGTAVVVIIAHVSGLFDFSGIMYVTQSKFKSATDALREGLDAVSKALQIARRELMERIGLLEKKMDEANAELKDQITATSNAVRDDLAKVSNDVKDVGLVVGNLEMKLGSIDGGMGDLRSAMEKANKGIQLLCHVVAESYRYNGKNQRDQAWYADLLSYTKSTPSIESATDSSTKQIKQNGEGPVMRLISGSSLGGNADGGGGGLASIRETLNRQLSGVLDPST